MEYIEEKENNLVKSAALISQFKTLLFGRQNDKKIVPEMRSLMHFV